MTRAHRITVTVLAVGLAMGTAACSDEGPSAPPGHVSPQPPAGVVVSNVQVSPRALAYASAVTGTFPGAGSAAVRNRTRSGAYQYVELIDGGFDPVAIDAAAGDELSLTVYMATGSTTFAVEVPHRRLPTVVRTNLPKDRIDVAVNALILLVFSEPVDKSTVTSSSVFLLRDEGAVNGSVHVSADGLTAEFTPDGELQPRMAYSLIISEEIRDLDGDGIGQTSGVSFTTAGFGTTSEETSATGQLIFANLSDGQIYRIGVGGTGLTRLTGSGRNSRPAWSPDGERIAFSTYVPSPGGNGTNDIYTMDADGSNVVRRTHSGNLSSAAWSPDSRKLAVSAETIYWSNIYLLSADEDGSEPILLATQGRSPAWSPDGRSIAFVHVSGDDGYGDIAVMNADGTELRPLLTIGDPGGINGLGWSPDGQRLAFSKCLSARCDLYVMNADGSELRRITDLGNATGAAWSPDGEWIAITLSTYSGVSWLPTIAFVSAEGGIARVVAKGYWPAWGR